MQHTAALAVAAVVMTLSTALPSPTSGLGGGDDVSGDLISDLVMNIVEHFDIIAKEMTSLEKELNEQQSIIEEQAAELKTQAEINEKQSMFETKMIKSISEIEDGVRNETEDLTDEMTQLESKVTNQKDDIEEIENKNFQQENAIASIKNVNNDQTRKLEELDTDIKKEEHTNTAQASQLTKLTNPQHFSVYLKSSKIVAPHKILVFDGVIDDPKSLYSRSTGVFECKVPGVYVFTLTAHSQMGKDGKVVLGIFFGNRRKAETATDGHQDQSSSTVTLTLKRGDKVTVKGGWDTSHVYGDDQLLTTFTGRLVTPTK